MIIEIDENVRLELTAQKHAQPLYDAVDSNREHLSRFLPWVGNMQSVNDFTEFIKNCECLYEEKKEVSFVIILNETAVGRIGFHYINQHNKSGAIGYWLARNAEGRGIITRACKKLITHGFKELGLHRIEIKAATTNFKSGAIAEKLSFKKEGVLREATLVNGQFLDLNLYSMLSTEWENETMND